jgi:lipid-A-disaccharide synthase-like uncharacterized protein
MFDAIIDFFRKIVTEQIMHDPFWASVGLLGQLFFGGRFVLQWIASEYRKQSYVPVAFWYLSIIGSLMLLSYSVHISNPVFILGFSLNTLIYLRNLHLIYRMPKSAAGGPA